MSFQRGLVSHSCCSRAACWLMVSTLVPSSGDALPIPEIRALSTGCPAFGGLDRDQSPKILRFFTVRKVILSFVTERFAKFGLYRWYRPCDLRPAAPSSAPDARPHPGRARRADRPRALGPLAHGERPPGAEALADRAAGVGPLGAGDRAAEPAAAQPPGPAGDRPGRRAAGPLVPAARPAAAEDRRARPHRRARAPGRGGGGAARPAVQARRHPGGGPGGERGAA